MKINFHYLNKVVLIVFFGIALLITIGINNSFAEGIPPPIPAPVLPEELGLKEGDLISADNDPDIYIVNEHGYKRLFLNPVIFNFYGHLGGFQNVKNITPQVRDAFRYSGLFRNCEINDERVYDLQVGGEDSGILHWMNISGNQVIDQDPDFFKKIFCINNNEFNWYTQNGQHFGTPYTHVSDILLYDRGIW